MPRVNIEEEAFVDQRIELLGELAGYNRFEALGRLAHLWRMCTKRGSYVLSEAMVSSCLGPKGAEAIVTAELGERTPEGIRIKGTETRIEWPSTYSSTKQAAGRARASTASRDAKGRLLPRSASPAQPADIQQNHPAQPAESSALSSGSDLSPDLSSLPPELPDLAVVRAERDPGPLRHAVQNELAAAAARVAAQPRDRKIKLALDAWHYGALKHSELKSEGIDPTAIGWGIQPTGEAWDRCKARVDDVLASTGDPANFAAAEEVFRRRIDVAAAEARRDRDMHGLRWFIPIRMFEATSFETAAAMSPEQAARPRAGPKSAPHRNTEPPPRKLPTYR